MDYNPVQNHYLISVKRPWYWVLSAVICVLLLMTSLWIAYNRGRLAGGFDSSEAGEEIAGLKDTVSQLQSELADLQRINTALERNNYIEKDANLQVKETLVELQDEILKLNEEVTFYRSLVSPEKSKRRLHLQDLQFVRKDGNQYGYKIVVTQRGNNNKVVRGSLKVTLVGEQDGKTVTRSLNTLVPKEDQKFKLGFKYFQRFEGILNLPEGFYPSTLRVQVVPRTSRLVRIDTSLDWATVISEGENFNVGEQQEGQVDKS